MLKLHGVCQPPPHRLSCNAAMSSAAAATRSSSMFEPPDLAAVPLPFTASFSPPCWLAGWLVNPRRSALVDALFHCFAVPIRNIFISFWSGRTMMMMMMMMMQQFGFTESSPDKQSIYPHAKKTGNRKTVDLFPGKEVLSVDRWSCLSLFLLFFVTTFPYASLEVGAGRYRLKRTKCLSCAASQNGGGGPYMVHTYYPMTQTDDDDVARFTPAFFLSFSASRKARTTSKQGRAADLPPAARHYLSLGTENINPHGTTGRELG
ncbi:hypothetical protein B0T24DRAFT_380242 [Lasiosphaeria ovina]|uniref:Uncharacterized protein n=1 Tax=Lasiosphaeria ovina TaxID=92902 RepID=A0AAE0K0H2_9PEZI|nr:hypothetical protein B0T24DRAFT_380242 [Lasiosphaeria ovina]